MCGLDELVSDRLETWVRLPERAVTFGRGAPPEPPAPYVQVSHGTVSRRHCRLHLNAGRWVLVDLKTSGGTALEVGDKVTAARPLGLGDGAGFFVGAPSTPSVLVRVHRADLELDIADETERALLDDLRDRAMEDVYLDWLEQRGHGDRAELLRLRRSLESAELPSARVDELARYTALAQRIDPGWRLRLSMSRRSR